MSTRRSTAGIAASALVALVLAACGGGLSGEQRLAGAGERTTEAGTARFTLEQRLQQEGEGATSMNNMTMTGEGEADFGADRMRLATDIPGMPSGEQMQLVIDGDEVYVNGPLPGDDDRWVQHTIDEEDPMASASMRLGGFTGPMSDPTGMLTTATRSPGEVEDLGTQEVREVHTTGYGFTVTVAELLDLDADSGGIEHLADVDVDAEAWLDRDDRVRRLRLDFDLEPLSAGLQAWANAHDDDQAPAGSTPNTIRGTYTTTIDWFDLGEPVEIAVPTEDQIVEQDVWTEQMTESDSGTLEAEATEDIVVPEAREHVEEDSGFDDEDREHVEGEPGFDVDEGDEGPDRDEDAPNAAPGQ